MTVSEHDELEYLARARRAMSPKAGDAERVLAAIGGALAAPPATDLLEAAASPGPLASSGALGTLGTTGAKLAVWLAVSAVTLGAGGAGYYFGYRAGKADAANERALASQKPNAPLELISAPVVPAPAPPAQSAVASEPKTTVPNPAPRSSALSAHSLAPPLASAAVDPKLEEETRLVVRVERALRDDNPRFALGLLGELDRTLPGGQLAEEREAARVMAHCQLGSEFAPRLSREFAARRPQSSYLARIRKLCESVSAKATDPVDPGDSSFKEGRFP